MIFCIFLAICFLVLKLCWMSASPPSYTRAMYLLKSFWCPRYWADCQLCQWAKQGRISIPFEMRQLLRQEWANFQARFAIDVTDVGGGTSTPLPNLPWHGQTSNDGTKAETPPNDLYSMNMHNMLNLHNMQYIYIIFKLRLYGKYAEYA